MLTLSCQVTDGKVVQIHDIYVALAVMVDAALLNRVMHVEYCVTQSCTVVIHNVIALLTSTQFKSLFSVTFHASNLYHSIPNVTLHLSIKKKSDLAARCHCK